MLIRNSPSLSPPSLSIPLGKYTAHTIQQPPPQLEDVSQMSSADGRGPLTNERIAGSTSSLIENGRLSVKGVP